MRRTFYTLAALATVLGTGAAAATETAPPPPIPYPLDYCIVSGETLGGMGTPASIQFEGRELRFCCAGCVPEFQRDPRAYLKKIDGAVAEQQRPRYPIDTCVIDGKPLGVSPVELVHRDRLVRVCSEACRAAFVAAPEPALAALDREVIARQRPTYPLDVCPVSGEKLGGMGDPADYVFRGELVRFCCAGCVGPFLKDPAAALAKIRAAREAAAVPRPSATD